MKKSPLARKTDPQTSHDAAKKAMKFVDTHISTIYQVLKDYKPIRLTPSEIAERSWNASFYQTIGYHAVQRRGAEMERKGLIIRGPGTRYGQRVWRLAK